MSKRGRPGGPPRKTVSFRLQETLYTEAQECCYQRRLVLTDVLEDFLTTWLAEQRKQHNKGKPFTVPSQEEE